MYKFNAAKETQNVINWIKNWFETESGGAAGIIIGISGGADSTVVAKLCCDAIGSDKVRGLLLPNNSQSDISDSYKVCSILGLKYNEFNVGGLYSEIFNWIQKSEGSVSEQTKLNIAPRLRMTAIYALGQTLNCRVAGTGNLSERYVGYCTKWGMDTAHDFNPIANFTKTEVKQIGDCLGLPRELVHKTPADGLSGLSDEENMKITYDALDVYIRMGTYQEKDKEMIDRIIRLNKLAQHKINPIPCYKQ